MCLIPVARVGITISASNVFTLTGLQGKLHIMGREGYSHRRPRIWEAFERGFSQIRRFEVGYTSCACSLVCG